MARLAESISTPSRDDFAAMLEESYIERSPAEGAVVKGIIVAVENDFVVVDVGLKTEGRVPVKEFSVPGQNTTVKVGDEVEVYVERVENALGEAVLSRDKARREESWTRLEKAFQDSGRASGVIFGRVKGGFTVDLDGAVAFLPGSQVDVRPVRDVGPLMNMPQPFQILKMDRRRGNIVVSRRAVLEEKRAEERSELVASLAEGQVLEGTVKNITDYGAFVDLGGVDGLLHVTDIARRRVSHPRIHALRRPERHRADHQGHPRDSSAFRWASSNCRPIRGGKAWRRNIRSARALAQGHQRHRLWRLRRIGAGRRGSGACVRGDELARKRC